MAITQTSIAVLTNDAAFLANILRKYMQDENFTTPYLVDLVNHLNPEIGC
jgi:hypothetical protein